MNQTFKTTIISAAVALSASLVTVFATTQFNDTEKSSESSFLTFSNKGSVYNASMSAPGEPANFVEAAESTVNGVVSIKSFVSPRAQSSVPQ